MPVDENGEPFYETQHSQQDSFKTETLPDGSRREIRIKGKTTTVRQRPEEFGWFKKGEWSEVVEKTVWRPVKDTEDFEQVKSLVLMQYALDVTRTPCQFCAGQERNYDYLKRAASMGLVRRCFRMDITGTFISSTNKLAFKFLGEKRISREEAFDLIMSGKSWCGDWALRKSLGIPSNL
jgi:hypothetical protein